MPGLLLEACVLSLSLGLAKHMPLVKESNAGPIMQAM